MRQIFIIVIMLFASLLNQSLALAHSEKVTLVFIHGVLNQDYQTTYYDAKNAFEKFKAYKKSNKALFNGDYEIDDFVVLNWGQKVRENPNYKYFDYSIDNLSKSYNRPVAALYSLGTNSKIYNKVNKGLYNFGYDLIYSRTYTQENEKILTEIMDSFDIKVKEGLHKTNNKYIIMAHSAGSLMAIRFMADKIAQDQFLKSRFAGLITYGAPVNIFLTSHLATVDRNNPQNTEEIKRWDNLQSLLKKNHTSNYFWLDINHRRDAVASYNDLNDILSEINIIPKGTKPYNIYSTVAEKENLQEFLRHHTLGAQDISLKSLVLLPIKTSIELPYVTLCNIPIFSMFLPFITPYALASSASSHKIYTDNPDFLVKRINTHYLKAKQGGNF